VALAGLLLLTGGLGRRFGGPKHLQPHPAGGSWGGHLAAVFEAVFPGAPMQLLGEGLPDRPDLAPLADPRQGPALALRHWAAGAGGGSHPERWWIVACDQIGWTGSALDAWHGAVSRADPAAALAFLRTRLGESAAAVVPGPDLPARIAAERLAMRARFATESDVTLARLRWLISVITGMGALFGVAMLNLAARAC